MAHKFEIYRDRAGELPRAFQIQLGDDAFFGGLYEQVVGLGCN